MAIFPRVREAVAAMWKGLASSDVREPALPMFLSEDEIVGDILAKIRQDDAAIKSWLEQSRSDLILGHQRTGRYIRNHYDLWHDRNPYTRTKAEPNAQGVVDHPLHPDQVSQRIIERVWGEVKAEFGCPCGVTGCTFGLHIRNHVKEQQK